MAAAKTSRTNTPTEQNKEDNSLVLYRLTQVEVKVDTLLEKSNSKDSVTKQDLLEFRTNLLETLRASFDAIQKEVDDKAEKSDVSALEEKVREVKGLIKALGAAFTTVITALVVYYLTTGRN